jgi:hypothetical protein
MKYKPTKKMTSATKLKVTDKSKTIERVKHVKRGVQVRNVPEMTVVTEERISGVNVNHYANVKRSSKVKANCIETSNIDLNELFQWLEQRLEKTCDHMSVLLRRIQHIELGSHSGSVVSCKHLQLQVLRGIYHVYYTYASKISSELVKVTQLQRQEIMSSTQSETQLTDFL